MAGLISDQLIENLRNVAYRQLVTPVTIERLTTVAGVADTTRSWSTVLTTTAWLVSKNKPFSEEDIGHREVAVNNYELRLRFGTDIQGGDRCLIGGEIYNVGDTNAEVTLTLFLKATLRKSES